VIAGVGFNRAIAIELAKASAKAGADAIFALPPYYPNADEDALLEYYRLDRHVDRPRLPRLQPRLGEPVGRRGSRSSRRPVPNLVAWKDGQGDIRRYAQIMQRLGDRLHWIGGVGDDNLPAYYSIGIRTYTSSIATVAPRLSSSSTRSPPAATPPRSASSWTPTSPRSTRSARAGRGTRSRS
jgi:hypothetical protein